MDRKPGTSGSRLSSFLRVSRESQRVASRSEEYNSLFFIKLFRTGSKELKSRMEICGNRRNPNSG